MAAEIAPTTQGFLDTDKYKLTMGQYVFHQHPNVVVVYGSKNRTPGVNLEEVIDERDLRHELDRIQNTRPTTEELDYLANDKLDDGSYAFKEDYLDFLANEWQLSDYTLNDKLEIKTKGLWKNDINWETQALATQNDLYFRALTKDFSQEQIQELFLERDRRLEEKIEVLEVNPGALFMEFGTRRRESYQNQDYVIGRLKARVPGNIVGTSNVHLAKKHDLVSMGTEAHERYMVLAAIMGETDTGLRASHNLAIDQWFEEYGAALSVNLTDTFGTDFFFKDMGQRQAELGKGMRQDSGDPFLFKKRQIEFYEQRGIDPTNKLFVPSDGLDVDKIVALNNYLPERIKQVAGWGTNLTNDMGFQTLSLVMKAVEANGRPTVKLSDNPAKAIGPAEEVARYQRVFEYDPTKYKAEKLVY